MTKGQKRISKKDAKFYCEIYEAAYGITLTPDEVIRVFERMDNEIGKYIRTNHQVMNEQEEEELKTKIQILFQKLLKELRDSAKCKYMPTSSAISSIIDAMHAGQNGQNNIDNWLKRKTEISHTNYSVTHGDPMNGEQGKIIFRHDINNGQGYVKLKIPDAVFNELLGFSVAPRKIFVFLLEKINEQAFHDNHLTRNYVDFQANELIERGVYTTRQSALKGLKIAMNILTGIQIEGEYRFNKNNIISYSSKSEGGNIFRFWENVRGNWRVYIEENANWRFIFQAFSILPIYYYRLPYRASELLYLIFTKARQNTGNIKERGYFTIGFRTIQQALNLPDEDKIEHPQRDIKDVINNAIDDIDEAQQEEFDNEDLMFLSAEYNDEWPISQFLSQGYLQVSLSGIFAQPFIEIQDDRIKELEKVKRKKEKTLEKVLSGKNNKLIKSDFFDQSLQTT